MRTALPGVSPVGRARGIEPSSSWLGAGVSASGTTLRPRICTVLRWKRPVPNRRITFARSARSFGSRSRRRDARRAARSRSRSARGLRLDARSGAPVGPVHRIAVGTERQPRIGPAGEVGDLARPIRHETGVLRRVCGQGLLQLGDGRDRGGLPGGGHRGEDHPDRPGDHRFGPVGTFLELLHRCFPFSKGRTPPSPCRAARSSPYTSRVPPPGRPCRRPERIALFCFDFLPERTDADPPGKPNARRAPDRARPEMNLHTGFARERIQEM